MSTLKVWNISSAVTFNYYCICCKICIFELEITQRTHYRFKILPKTDYFFLLTKNDICIQRSAWFSVVTVFFTLVIPSMEIWGIENNWYFSKENTTLISRMDSLNYLHNIYFKRWSPRFNNFKVDTTTLNPISVLKI